MKLRIVFILLVIFVIGCVREQNDNSIQSGITKGDDDLSKIVRDENAISQLANEDAALRNLFQKKNWDESILDETSVLKLSSVTRQCFYYDLIDPAFIYSNHEETDQALFYDQGFIAIGTCGNGDFILVFAARNSEHFDTGAVYMMSHEHGWEIATDQPKIIPQITRKIAADFKSFLELVKDENANLPVDYVDGNEDAYKPEYFKRGPKAMERKTDQRP